MSDTATEKAPQKYPPLPDIRPGLIFETVLYRNKLGSSTFPYRATLINGRSAPKVILAKDGRVPIQTGRPCRVKVKSVTRQGSDTRGQIEVEHIGVTLLSTEGSDFYIDERVASKLQAFLESGLNILLDGPQGSGKTVLSRKIAEALNYEYVFFNCAAIYEATDFIASLQIRQGDKGGTETIWLPTDIYRALESANADPARRILVFLDEFNRCRELARNGIMPALDSTRKMYNPLTGSTVSIPDNIQWIAAINNGAQFTGTTSVDPAQLDRFATIKMSYPPAEEEVKILESRYPGVERKQIVKIVDVANKIRDDENLGLDLSVRATEEACVLLGHPNFSSKQGANLATVLETSFCGRFQGTIDDESTDSGMVWNAVKQALSIG